jgi:hypothetical protein
MREISAVFTVQHGNTVSRQPFLQNHECRWSHQPSDKKEIRIFYESRFPTQLPFALGQLSEMDCLQIGRAHV